MVKLGRLFLHQRNLSQSQILFVTVKWNPHADNVIGHIRPENKTGYKASGKQFFGEQNPSVVYFDQCLECCAPREGVIMEWPLNDLFNDGRVVIISSGMAVIIINCLFFS